MRLVDVDDFIEKLAIAPLVQEAMRKAVNHMPTVEVVRCENCRHFEDEDEDGNCWCFIHDDFTKRDAFCSWGERGEERLVMPKADGSTIPKDYMMR